MNTEKKFIAKISICIAAILFSFSAVQSQDSLIDSLSAVVQKSPADTSKLNGMYALSRQLFISGQNEKALQLLEEIQSFIATLSSQKGEQKKQVHQKLKSESAKAINLKGVIYKSKGDFNEALKYCLEALKIREELNDQQGMAGSYVNISGLYSTLGDDANELKYMELAIKNFEAINDKKGLGLILHNQSQFYFAHGDYEKALATNLKAQKFSEEAGDLINITFCLIYTGVVYNEMGEYDKSIEYILKALDLTAQTGDKSNEGIAYSNLGLNYQYKGDLEKAFYYQQKYLQVATEMNDKKNIAHAYYMLSSLFESERERKIKNNDASAPVMLDSAMHYSLLAKRQYEEIGAKDVLATALLFCGKFSIKKKKFDDALSYLQQALQIALESENKRDRMHAYLYLSDLYAAKNEFEKALKFHTSYADLKDSILNETSIKNISELNSRFEAEKKDNQITLLKNQQTIDRMNIQQASLKQKFALAGLLVLLLFSAYTYYRYRQRIILSNRLSASFTELKQTQSQLIETERQREQEKIRLRISRDIHDEIGGNLTKIALLSDVISSETKTNGSETKQSLDKISEYARNVNTSLSEIVWSVNPKQDTLESLIAYMRNYIHSFLSDTGINFTINFPEPSESVSLNPDLKRNIFLVLKESLNNAVKYSRAKNITIRFNLNEKQFQFNITDDGIGMNGEQKSASGNGLNNMRFRMEQSGCQLKIVTSPGNGCEINASGNIS
ncbi:MAG TPA: tetratricopeptide repeat protein [Bacteroidia bacterium]|nr:tetratricopeptide repeat protein [Bacteroidia bacterium]